LDSVKTAITLEGYRPDKGSLPKKTLRPANSPHITKTTQPSVTSENPAALKLRNPQDGGSPGYEMPERTAWKSSRSRAGHTLDASLTNAQN
jgi:hypothetical protein